MAHKITVDRNLIIAVQNNEPEKSVMMQIFKAHNAGRLSVGISASNRVENQLDGVEIQGLDSFLNDCKTVGLQNPEVLDYPLDWEMGLWEHGTISTDAYALELTIHEILHPTAPTFLSDSQPDYVRRRVRNRKCDVFAMWSHIWFERDVFLTKDKRFIKRRVRLEKIGAKGIFLPHEFVDANPFVRAPNPPLNTDAGDKAARAG